VSEQIETRFKKGRGMAKASLELIEAMREIAEATQPITGRGVGYRLFVAKLIASMELGEMQRVYRLLKEARERGMIPWEWIVDETRELERVASWDDPADYVSTVSRAYRRDFWQQSINPSVLRCGARRAPCAGCSRRCSTNMAWASG
jgi:hypothetical protein